MAGVIAVANQARHGEIGFANPLYYKLLHTPALHDIVAPASPLAQVRTEYTDGVDASGGFTYRMQTIDPHHQSCLRRKFAKCGTVKAISPRCPE